MAETQGQSDGKGLPPKRWYQFSLRTMVIVVAVICVVLAIAVGIRQFLFYMTMKELRDPSGTPTEIVLRDVLRWPRWEAQPRLEEYAAESSQRAWFPEQEAFFYVEFKERGSWDFNAAMTLLCCVFVEDKQPSWEMTGFAEELNLQSLQRLNGKHLEITFVVEGSLASELGIEPGSQWIAEFEVATLLEYMKSHSQFDREGRVNRCRWLLDHSTATGEAKAVPDGKAAR